MPKKRNEDTDVLSEVEQPRRRSYSRKLKLAVTDDGLDWGSIDPERETEVLAALVADDKIRATVAEFNKSDASESSSKLIDSEHLNFFLDAIEAAEQFFIPRMVARKAIGGLAKGQFQIHPEVAKRAFKFQNRDKLVPLGVQAANANLPDKIKKLIARVGPGSKFVGMFFYELRNQQIRAIEMQVKWYQDHQRTHHAGVRASSPPASTGKQPPKPNGAEVVPPAPVEQVVAAPVDESSEQIA